MENAAPSSDAIPATPIVERATSHGPRTNRWWMFVAAMVFVVAHLLLFGKDPDRLQNEALQLTIFVLAASQVSLTSIWLIEGRMHVLVRLAISLLVFGMSVNCIARTPDTALVWTIIFVAQGACIMAPLGVLASLGRRLSLDAGDDSLEGLQFTIRHLALWTLGASVLMVGVRQAMNLLGAVEQSPVSLFVVVPYLAFSMGFLALISLWAALGKGNVLIRFVHWVAVAFLLAHGVEWVLEFDIGNRLIQEFIFAHGLLVGVTLLTVRLAGYRFVSVVNRP